MDGLVAIFLTAAALAVSLNVIFKRLQVPTIIGYIVTGVFISQIFGLHGDKDLLHVAEFGIVFLMFTIGLEFSLKHLMSMKKEVFFNGLLQVMISGGVYSLAAQYIFGIDQKSAIIIGFALALSSTAIVLKQLNDSGDIHTVYGRKALGILLFQDIAVIPLLLMINIFTADATSVSSLLWETFYSATIVLALLFVIGKYFLNKLLFWVVATDSNETFIATILFLVVGASYLAHHFGFSYSLGAFIAGMMIAETKYKHQIEADLIPFRDLLMGLFFITVGMQVNFDVITNYWAVILGLISVIMIIKAIVIFAILRTYKNSRVSFKAAVAISQVGEFSLAVFELARANSLLPTELAQILIVMVIVSMVATPFILKNLKKIADKVLPEQTTEDYKIESAGIKNHFIICGYGKLGQEVVYRLKKQDIPYIVIENDINLVRLGKSRNEPVFFGNAAQKNILESAYVENASAVIVAIDNEHNLRLLCETLDTFKKQINTIVKVSDYEEKQLLEDLHVNHIVNEGREIAKALIKEASHCRI